MNNAKTVIKLVRAANVKRYHTVPIIGEQTVGHHTHRLLMVLRYIAGGVVSNDLLWKAMFHDLAESVTGDIPAPIKWSDSSLRDSVGGHENDFLSRTGAETWTTKDEDLLLSIADMLELVLFATEQIELGNSGMKELRLRGMTYIFERMPLLPADVKERVTLLIKETNK